MKASYTCPECYKAVKDLPGHLARVHGKTQTQIETTSETTTKKELETLEIENEDKQENEPTYHCVECGATLTKGVAACPNCQEPLQWPEA